MQRRGAQCLMLAGMMAWQGARDRARSLWAGARLAGWHGWAGKLGSLEVPTTLSKKFWTSSAKFLAAGELGTDHEHFISGYSCHAPSSFSWPKEVSSMSWAPRTATLIFFAQLPAFQARISDPQIDAVAAVFGASFTRKPVASSGRARPSTTALGSESDRT